MINLFLSNNDDAYKADKTLETFKTFTITYVNYNCDMLKASFRDGKTNHQVARIMIDLKYDRRWYDIGTWSDELNRELLTPVSYEDFVLTLSKERPDIMSHLLWYF